jgi:hypothetical protein
MSELNESLHESGELAKETPRIYVDTERALIGVPNRYTNIQEVVLRLARAANAKRDAEANDGKAHPKIEIDLESGEMVMNLAAALLAARGLHLKRQRLAEDHEYATLLESDDADPRSLADVLNSDEEDVPQESREMVVDAFAQRLNSIKDLGSASIESALDVSFGEIQDLTGACTTLIRYQSEVRSFTQEVAPSMPPELPQGPAL